MNLLKKNYNNKSSMIRVNNKIKTKFTSEI